MTLRMHVNIGFICATYLNIIVDQVNPFIAVVSAHGSAPFQHDNTPCHLTHNVLEWFKEQRWLMINVKGVALAVKFSFDPPDNMQDL